MPKRISERALYKEPKDRSEMIAGEKVTKLSLTMQHLQRSLPLTPLSTRAGFHLLGKNPEIHLYS